MKIVIVGCGIVGALLAYELSQQPDWSIVVVESQSQPVQGATGAALGLLMGVISQKIKGRAWQWRQTGLEYYHQLLPQMTGANRSVQYNNQGLLKLIQIADLPKWQSLANTRVGQGWPLEIWDRSQVLNRCPFLQLTPETMAIHSPADWQVNPAQFGRSIVAMAAENGVKFYWQTAVTSILPDGVQVTHGQISADWIIVAGGLDTVQLVPGYLELAPVLGQAIHCRIADYSLIHPVITANDVHTVPVGGGEYWVGATVEFPVGTTVTANPAALQDLKQQAIEYFPALAQAEILSSWSGLRPRPVGRPAPVVELLAIGTTPHPQVILATGHYRNGVLLAPATVNMVREILK
jgi:glycine/D-amino acid oxidase-like deaminating enzyme